MFAVAGLLFGSFLNVVIYRMPRRESIISPRSPCPRCGNPVSALDSVPVFSYLALGGRCRRCRTRISAEYPLVEAITAGLFVAAAFLLRLLSEAALVAPFLGVMLAAALIDMRHRIIPNRLIYPSLAVFGLAVVFLGVFGGEAVHPLSGFLGMLAFGGALLIVAVISPAGMGMGDVKLAGLIGLVLGALGLRYVGVAAMAAVLTGGAAAIALLLGGAGRKEAIPFGPFLAAGAVLAGLAGPALAS